FSLPGANGFPCCGKESVDTVLNPDPKLGPEWKPQAFKQPELCSGVVGKPEVKPKAEPKLQMANLEPYNEDPKPQGPRLESLHPHPEGLRQQDISQWSTKSNSSYLGFAEEEKVLSPDHRSIRVQTSRHLFWSDKLIQASEHSLQEKTQKSPTRTSRHPKKSCSRTPVTNPPCSPQTIGLAELINLASSLAVASSSKTDLPSLKHLIKAPPQKATEPSAEATTDKPKQEKPSQDLPPEKPLETRELPKAPKEEDRRLPHPYLDFSKPGFKRATIEGEVKFLQSPNMSPQPQGAEKDSVPGTKKGSPLLLKIHFKLSSPTSPEK
uniref:Spermatogenesis associated 32 n=1 Tax=Sus scrofa TaxID=9823 RepID=A0A4X1TDX9_PIG